MTDEQRPSVGYGDVINSDRKQSTFSTKSSGYGGKAMTFSKTKSYAKLSIAV